MSRGRHSKLSDAQWAEALRLHAQGETITSLAERFKVSKAAISRRISLRAKELKGLANSMAQDEVALERLPISEQTAVRQIVDRLKTVGLNLSRGAVHASGTFAELAKLAHEKVQSVSDEKGRLQGDVLAEIALLSATANRAATPALRLVTSNQESPRDITLEDLILGDGNAE